MTTNDIDAIRKQANAATCGPWKTGNRFGNRSLGSSVVVLAGNLPPVELDPHRNGRNDAGFIAAARTLVPALCDEIEHLRAAHDSAVEAIAEAESDIDDRDSEISTLKQDLDLQTKAAWDNRSTIEQLRAELEKVRGQYADTRRHNDLLTAELRDQQRANTAHANENAELRMQVYAQKPVIEAVEAWAEARETDPNDIPADEALKAEDDLFAAVEQYRLMDLALDAAHTEAEVAR